MPLHDKPRGSRWLGPLAGPVDRFLSGGRSADPLYLTNQTWWKKTLRVLLIILPLLLVAGVVAMSTFQVIEKKSNPAADLTAAEVAARSLPDYSKLDFGHPGDVAVLEAEVKDNGDDRVIFGRLRNNTDRRFASVEITFDTTNTQGAQLGAEKVVVEDVGPRAVLRFEFKAKSRETVFALVRQTKAR